MRRLLVWLLPAVLCGQQEVPVFRTTTRLIEFTMVVLDRKGQPVTDLRKDEVEILEKGKRRDIALFRYEGKPETPDQPKSPLDPGAFSNRAEFAPGPPRNITALVVDSLNTAPADQMWVRAQVVRYLKTMAPYTRIAVYLLGTQLRVLHDFTDDADSLRARIEKHGMALAPLALNDTDRTIREAEQLMQMFPDDPYLEQMLRDQIEMEMLNNAAMRERKLKTTLGALEGLGRHLEGIPGRKNLVWIGGGISMLSITGAMGFGPRGGIQSFEELVRQTSQRLAQQGITMYIVDARGLMGPSESNASVSGSTPVRGRGRFERQQQAETTSSDPYPAASTMADVTGGRYFQFTNDPTEGMRKAASDHAGTYSLGFYSGDEPDGKWHGLKVKVNRPGVKLVHRQGFLAESGKAASPEWTAEEWRAVSSNPLGSSAIHLDARLAREAGGFRLVMQIEPKDLSFQPAGEQVAADIEIALAERNETGLVAIGRRQGSIRVQESEFAMVDPSRCRFEHVWTPGAGVTSLRMIVRDRRNGRYGTLDLPLSRIPAAPVP